MKFKTEKLSKIFENVPKMIKKIFNIDHQTDFEKVQKKFWVRKNNQATRKEFFSVLGSNLPDNMDIAVILMCPISSITFWVDF